MNSWHCNSFPTVFISFFFKNINCVLIQSSMTHLTSGWSPGLVCCDQTQFSFLSFSGAEDFNLGSWWQMIPWTTWKIVHNRAWHSRSCVLMWNMKNNAPPSTLSARDLFLECQPKRKHTKRLLAKIYYSPQSKVSIFLRLVQNPCRNIAPGVTPQSRKYAQEP